LLWIGCLRWPARRLPSRFDLVAGTLSELLRDFGGLRLSSLFRLTLERRLRFANLCRAILAALELFG